MNILGFFNCICRIGFMGNGFSCEDVDECLIDVNLCLIGNGLICIEFGGCF